MRQFFAELNFRCRGHLWKFITGFISLRQVRKGFLVSLSWNLGGSCCRSTLVRETRPLRTVRAVAVNGCIDIDGTFIAHFKYVPRKDRLYCTVLLLFYPVSLKTVLPQAYLLFLLENSQCFCSSLQMHCRINFASYILVFYDDHENSTKISLSTVVCKNYYSYVSKQTMDILHPMMVFFTGQFHYSVWALG